MDKQYINSILGLISHSRTLYDDCDIRKITYENNGKKKMEIDCGEVICLSQGSRLSESWIVENIVLFTLFDGYLEDRYSLTEGDSFLQHYRNMPETSEMEIMIKNMFRLLKIMRNAITHNLGHTVFNKEKGFYTDYQNRKGQRILLECSYDSIRALYTNIAAVIGQSQRTAGHREGFMKAYYRRMISGITKLQDEIGTSLLKAPDSMIEVCPWVRYQITNPIVIRQNEEKIVFERYKVQGEDYHGDYVWKGDGCEYLIPDEAMVQDKNELCIKKADMEKWKIS